jgi:hypothetical protein
VQTSLLDALQTADGSRRLPRLGGMARPTGVVIASERFWAFAGVDGTLAEGTMPRPPQTLMRLPLLRGLVRLALALAPIARRTGTATRAERLLLLGALVLPFGLFFLPPTLGLAVGGAAMFTLLVLLFRGPTLRLHGAEHRAIAAAEERRLVASWDGSARPSRFSLRCGTNFAVLAVPITVLAERLLPLPAAVWSPAVVTVFSLTLTMELWQAVQASGSRLAQVFLLPGLGAQRLTTRDPDLEQTRIALRAVASVLQRERES